MAILLIRKFNSTFPLFLICGNVIQVQWSVPVIPVNDPKGPQVLRIGALVKKAQHKVFCGYLLNQTMAPATIGSRHTQWRS